jgi:hypothetical protein
MAVVERGGRRLLHRPRKEGGNSQLLTRWCAFLPSGTRGEVGKDGIYVDVTDVPEDVVKKLDEGWGL